MFAWLRSLFGFSQSQDWSGHGYLAVVGESQHQPTLRRIAKRGRFCEAVLIPEPTNPFDGNAVVVKVGGDTIGYLSRADARRYQRRLLALPAPLRCPAKLIGGTWNKPSFGVLLDHREVERLPTPKRVRQRKQQMMIDPSDQPF